MTFTRVSGLGSLGVVLLQLLACSASNTNEPSRVGDANAQNERVHANGVSDESPPVTPLTAADVPKWKNVLEKPPVYAYTEHTTDGVVDRHDYRVTVRQMSVQILPPDFPKTPVFGYAGLVSQGDSSTVAHEGSPGATFEMTRGMPAQVEWINDISTPYFCPSIRRCIGPTQTK